MFNIYDKIHYNNNNVKLNETIIPPDRGSSNLLSWWVRHMRNFLYSAASSISDFSCSPRSRGRKSTLSQFNKICLVEPTIAYQYDPCEMG